MDDPHHLLALLKDRDCPCPACGYNLRGANQLACPECGKAFDPTILLNRRARFDAAWLTMVIAYSIALPWSILYVWQRLLIRGRVHYADDWNSSIKDYGKAFLDRSKEEAIWMLASSAWWLSVPFVLALLITFRRRILGWPKAVRWALAVACVVMVLLAYRRWQWWYYSLGFNGSRYADWPMWYID